MLKPNPKYKIKLSVCSPTCPCCCEDPQIQKNNDSLINTLPHSYKGFRSWCASNFKYLPITRLSLGSHFLLASKNEGGFLFSFILYVCNTELDRFEKKLFYLRRRFFPFSSILILKITFDVFIETERLLTSFTAFKSLLSLKKW